MRINPDAIEAYRPDDREIALLAAEVRRLQAVINSEEPTLTNEEREAILLAVEHGENTSSLRPLRPIWTLTLRRLLERTN